MSKSVTVTAAPPQAERSPVARPPSLMAASPMAVVREGMGNRGFGAFLQAQMASGGAGDGLEPDAEAHVPAPARALVPPASAPIVPPPPPEPPPVVQRQADVHGEEEEETTGGGVIEIQRRCAACEDEEEQTENVSPGVQRKCADCEEEEEAAGAVQGKCAPCEEEEQEEAPAGVQPKIIVGPADDPYEREEDIECEEGAGEGSGGEGQVTPERAALLRLQEQIGDDDKLAALAELSRASGAERGAQLSAADIDAIARAMQNTGVTAAQMREWAADFGNAGGRPVTDFRRFFQQMVDRRRPGAPQGGTPIPTPTVPEPPPPPPEPPPDAGRAGDGTPTPTPTPTPDTGGGADAGAEGEREGPAIRTFNAEDVPFDGPGGGVSGNTFDILNASSAHTLGTRTRLTFLGYRGRQAVAIVTGVSVAVVRRSYFPAGSAAGTATHMVIHYRIERGFNIPGSGALTTGRVVCHRLGLSGNPTPSPVLRCP